MTISQANNINTLASFLLKDASLVGDPVTEAQAKEALAELAEHAYKALMAGWRGEDVRGIWREGGHQRAGRFRRDHA